MVGRNLIKTVTAYSAPDRDTHLLPQDSVACDYLLLLRLLGGARCHKQQYPPMHTHVWGVERCAAA
jgi:hypothetical protein